MEGFIGLVVGLSVALIVIVVIIVIFSVESIRRKVLPYRDRQSTIKPKGKEFY